MNRKILTVEDLYNFCLKENKSINFSALKAGYEISVSSPGLFEVQDYKDDEGLLYCSLKAFHDLSNVNKSYINKDIFEKRMTTMKNRPIMADIVDSDKTDSDGNILKDFSGHTMYYDEEKEKTIYVEIPVGHVINPDNIRVEYDEEYQRDFALADCVIYEEYTDTCEILRRRKTVSCSVELTIREMSFIASTKELSIDDYYVQGITLLGENHLPGMKGSNVTLADFSVENNSIYFNQNDVINKIADAVINRLSDKKAEFASKECKEGGNPLNKFEELLKKYNKTEEEITFDYKELTDEELESKFAEVFETPASEQNFDGEESDEENTEVDDNEDTDQNSSEDSDDAEDENIENNLLGSDSSDSEDDNENEDTNDVSAGDDKSKKKKYSKVFEISHEDIRAGLFALLTQYEQEDNEWYWITKVYDDHFVYEGMFSEENIYDQKYVKDGDNISFEGERTHLHRELLTDSEMAALSEMRSNYSSIKSKLEKYEAEPEKLELFNSDDYANIKESEEFVTLRDEKNHFDLSVDEVKDKLDQILLSYAKSGKIDFSKNDENKYPTIKKLFTGNKNNKSSRYGNLFAKK